MVRYHKTLIVWTKSVDKHKQTDEFLEEQDGDAAKKNAAVKAKLCLVKNSLIEILGEAKQGISLA